MPVRAVLRVAVVFCLLDVLGSRAHLPANAGSDTVAVAGATAPSTDGDARSVVYIATAEGIARSFDGGDRWEVSSAGLTTTQHVGVRSHPTVNAVVVDPVTPATVYAATSYGVQKSIDAGVTWHDASVGLPEAAPLPPRTSIPSRAGVTDLVIHPTDPSILYALIDRPEPGGVRVFRTADSGATWHDISPQVVDRDQRYARTSSRLLFVEPTMPAMIYLVQPTALYRSDDAGVTWQRAGERSAGLYRDVVSSRVGGTLYATGSNSREIVKSVDHGETWAVAGIVPQPAGVSGQAPITHLAAGRDVMTIFATTEVYRQNRPESQLWRSVDGGATWTSCTADPLPDAVTALAADDTEPSAVFVATYNNNANRGLLHWAACTNDSWQIVQSASDVTGVLGRDTSIAAIAQPSSDPSVLYVGRPGGLFKRELDSTWIAALTFPTVPEITQLTVAPSNGTTVYAIGVSAGGTTLYRSIDTGTTWQAVEAFSQPGARILGIDPMDSNKIFVRTARDAPLQPESIDGGIALSVVQLPPPPSGDRLLVSTIAFDPSTPDLIYAGAQTGDRNHGGIARSRDGGSSWEWLIGNLPDCAVTSLAFIPASQRLLAGSTCGVTISDDGVHWRRVNVGLPDLPDAPRATAEISSLTVDSQSPTVVYAGITWSFGPYLAIPAGGVFKSTDSGETWIANNAGLPAWAPSSTLAPDSSVRPYLISRQIRELTVDPISPVVLYAVVAGATCPGGPTSCRSQFALYRSQNAAATWAEVSLPTIDGSIAVGQLPLDR